MPFDVGDRVVYPHHGASVIERRESIEVMGELRDYFVLQLVDAGLVLRVPVDKAEEVGLREVIDTEEVLDVMAVLAKKAKRTPDNWSRRFKNHTDMLRSGDIYQTAEVVRNLSLRGREAHLSDAEGRMLARARQVLISELHLALGVSEEEASRRVDEEIGQLGPPTARR
jgi:CarD family transcriptional regulator